MFRESVSIILMLISLNIYSQKVIHEDFFYDNQFNWPILDNQEIKTAISKQKYYISNKSRDNPAIIGQQFFFQTEEYFSIEVDFRISFSFSNEPFGIYFGATGWENAICFLITPNGFFNIFKIVDNNQVDISCWRESSIINGIGQNSLKIVNDKYQTSFYIQNNYVYSCEMIQHFGTQIGFWIPPSTTLKITRFKTTYDERLICLSDTMFRSKYIYKLPFPVNTYLPEINPLLSDSLLYVSTYSEPDNYSKTTYFDIWKTLPLTDSSWTDFTLQKLKTNKNYHNYLVRIFTTEKIAYLSGNFDSTGKYLKQGLAISQIKNNVWQTPLSLKIYDYYNWSEDVDFCISTNKKIIIMSVQRKNGYGRRDLYFSRLNNDNTYSQPINLGKQINTFGNEITPFLSDDEKYLYFSSDVHVGFGAYDIFVSERLDDSWTNWSKPINLGQTINTVANETYFKTFQAQKKAFFVSDFDGSEDIYFIKLN